MTCLPTRLASCMWLAAALLLALPARAAELDGVSVPETREAAGATLRLNGLGLRTYSILGIHIYVAGLYLQTASRDADAVLRSDQIKLLDIHFVHDVDVASARHAWSEGFEGNCTGSCHLPPDEVTRFLAAVPAFRRGDTSTLLFTREGVEVSINGHKVGMVDDPLLAHTILATFIGAEPPSARFKRGLLGQP